MIDRKKVRQDLLTTSADLLSELKKLEPSDNEVCASFNQQFKIVYEHNDFSLSSSHTSVSYGLRSIVNGKLGFVTSNNLTPAGLKGFAREAQMVASLSPQSPHNQIFEGAKATGGFDLFDESLASASARDLLHWGEEVIEEARKDSRVAIDRAEISLNTTVWSICNSKGVEMSASQTMCDWAVMGMAKTDQEVTSFDYDGSSVWQKSQVMDEIADSVSRFRESVINSLGAQKTKSYRGPVLFHPYAVMDLLGDLISSNCSGNAHTDNMSPWKGKLNHRVLSEAISAFEDPTDRARPTGWMPFDREGVLTQKREVISQGVLKHIAHNLFSASRAGTTTTGNAVGGSTSLPKVGFSNFAITGSPKARLMSDEDLMFHMGKGLVIKRFSGNSDAFSGEFSGVAKNSWVIQNGKYDHPVQEVMIAGNLFELFNKIIAVGKVNHILMGNSVAPYILVDDVSVTAG